MMFDQVRLPRHAWWTDYYRPLEARIQALSAAEVEALDPGELAQFQREINMVKADPDRFDCGFFIVRRSSRPSEDHARSKRSRFITRVQAATKSSTNWPSASALP